MCIFANRHLERLFSQRNTMDIPLREAFPEAVEQGIFRILQPHGESVARSGWHHSVLTKYLRSIVYNLLSNAVKYCNPRRRPLIRVRCATQGDYLRLMVSDNGLGMNLTHDTCLFTMFQRLHAHVEGTGVGLYIVKKIIEEAQWKNNGRQRSRARNYFSSFF